jgi:hypothetical protein
MYSEAEASAVCVASDARLVLQEYTPPAVAKKQKTAASAPPARKTPAAANWVQQAIRVHQAITTEPRSKIFRDPVSAKQAPDYFSIIKNPMDLKTIRKKLNTQRYHAPEEFAAVRPTLLPFFLHPLS